jgi:hypothetical protein
MQDRKTGTSKKSPLILQTRMRGLTILEFLLIPLGALLFSILILSYESVSHPRKDSSTSWTECQPTAQVA